VAPGQRAASFGQVRSAASRPPPTHTGNPCRVAVTRQSDGVTGDDSAEGLVRARGYGCRESRRRSPPCDCVITGGVHRAFRRPI
jgi:hypothetical protein